MLSSNNRCENVLSLSGLLVFFIPILYPFFDFFFNSGYLISLYIVAFLILIISFIELILKKEIRMNVNKIDVSFGIYIVYTFLNSASKGDGSLFNDDVYVLIIVILLYFSFRLSFTVTSSFSYSAFLAVVVLSVTFEIVSSYFQYIKVVKPRSGLFIITGMFTNPTVLCIFLSFVFPVLLYEFFVSKNRYRKFFFLILSSSIYFITIVCLCRIALIAILFTSFILSYIHVPFIRRKSRIIIIALGMTFTPLLIYILNVKKDSANGRVLIWKISQPMLSSNLVSGVGYGNYKKLYNIYQARYFKNEIRSNKEILLADENYYPYNEFYNVLIENGILGAVLFGIFFYYVTIGCYYSLKKYRFNHILPISLSIISIFFASFFSFPFQEYCLLAISVTFLAMFSSLYSSVFDLGYFPKISIENIWGVKLSGIPFVIASIFILWRTNLELRWYSLLKTPVVTSKELDAYEKLHIPLRGNSFFLTNYAINLWRNGRLKDAGAILEQSVKVIPSPNQYLNLGKIYWELNSIQKSEYYFSLASAIIPVKLLPKYYLLQLYKESGQHLKAKLMASEISKTPIKYPSDDVLFIKKEAVLFLNTSN